MAEKTRPVLCFSLFCDDIRQEVGGKISLMGIFENVYVTSLPAIHPRLAIINEWAEGVGEFETTLRLLSPDRKTVMRESISRLKLLDARYKQRDISIHLNIEIKEQGTYWIENYLDGVLVSSVPLNVVLVKEKSFH